MSAVLDASVLAEYLVGSSLGRDVAGRMARHDGALHVPHLAVTETVSVLRTWVRRGDLSPARAEAAIDDLRDLPARRWPAEITLTCVWQLRENATVHDATYVALAEVLDADLLTADVQLASGLSGLTTCRIVDVTAGGSPDP